MQIECTWNQNNQLTYQYFNADYNAIREYASRLDWRIAESDASSTAKVAVRPMWKIIKGNLHDFRNKFIKLKKGSFTNYITLLGGWMGL